MKRNSKKLNKSCLWKLTLDGYLRSVSIDEEQFIRIKNFKIIGSVKIQAQHKLAIIEAIEANKNIPIKILDDYPDLVKIYNL